MNLRQTFRYTKRRLIRPLVMAYAAVATWIQPRYPDFLGIGAPRAATTWLHQTLSSDPAFFLPVRKELHFYDEAEMGGDDSPGGDSELRWSENFTFDVERPAHQRWYWLQYRHAGDRLAGDITPAYSTLSVERLNTIRRQMPDVKIIYILRNPVERAWSGLRKSVWYQKGATYLEDKGEDWMLQQLMRPEVLLRGDYPRAIRNWEAVFPREQILYLFHDDIRSDPDSALDSVYQFLGVLRPESQHAGARSNTVNAAPSQPMPDAVKRALLGHYEEQIREIEHRFDRDLSRWRR